MGVSCLLTCYVRCRFTGIVNVQAMELDNLVAAEVSLSTLHACLTNDASVASHTVQQGSQ